MVILGGNCLVLVAVFLPLLAGTVGSLASKGSVAVKVQCIRCSGCFLSSSCGWVILCLLYQEVAGTREKEQLEKRMVGCLLCTNQDVS